jgi:DNA-binding MarR family transcriptional regulator
MSSQVIHPEMMPAVEAWIGLLRGHAAARRVLSARLSSEHGLSVNEYEALLLLSSAEALRRVDLAEGLQLTQSGVTRMLEGLEKSGLVERRQCPSDGRVQYAVLTEAGREKLREASCTHRAAVASLFEERFSCEEMVALAELLGRLRGCQRDLQA